MGRKGASIYHHHRRGQNWSHPKKIMIATKQNAKDGKGSPTGSATLQHTGTGKQTNKHKSSGIEKSVARRAPTETPDCALKRIFKRIRIRIRILICIGRKLKKLKQLKPQVYNTHNEHVRHSKSPDVHHAYRAVFF